MLVNHRMLNKYSWCYVSNKMIQHENIDTKANIYSLEENANNKKVRYFSFRFWKHPNMECHCWEKILDFSTVERTLHKPHTSHLQTEKKPNVMVNSFSPGEVECKMHTSLYLSLFHSEVKKILLLTEPAYTIETKLSPYYLASVQ